MKLHGFSKISFQEVVIALSYENFVLIVFIYVVHISKSTVKGK